MNPELIKKYGFKQAIINRHIVWLAEINGRQVCVDESNAGNSKLVEREIEMVQKL